MRYTRYDLRKNRCNFKIIMVTIFILTIGFLIGRESFKLLSKKVLKPTTSSAITECKGNEKNINFIIIQRGIYKNKQNVAESLNSIKSYGNPFTVEEDGKTRVLLGIFKEDDAKKIIQNLNKNKIENSTMKISIDKTTLCNVEIGEIINANLTIINKFNDSSIKSIKTDNIKKWCSSLEDVKKTSKNKKILNDLKSHISKLPNQFSKQNVDNNHKFVYKILKEFQKNKHL